MKIDQVERVNDFCVQPVFAIKMSDFIVLI